jgi:hypothetical protein
MFVVPRIPFRPLYGLLVLRHSRRELSGCVTTHPTAIWIARQLTEACGWSEPPRYIIRDRDNAYGEDSAPQSHGHTGPIRRECLGLVDSELHCDRVGGLEVAVTHSPADMAAA